MVFSSWRIISSEIGRNFKVCWEKKLIPLVLSLIKISKNSIPSSNLLEEEKTISRIDPRPTILRSILQSKKQKRPPKNHLHPYHGSETWNRSFSSVARHRRFNDSNRVEKTRGWICDETRPCKLPRKIVTWLQKQPCHSVGDDGNGLLTGSFSLRRYFLIQPRRYPGKIDRRGRDSRMTRALHASIVTWTECECVSFFFFAEESTRIFIHPRKTRLFGTRGKYSWGERVGIEIDTVGNCWIILHECSWCRVGGGGRKGRGREKEV